MATVEKRPLTKQEIEDAKRLMAAWRNYQRLNKGATQEWLANETGLGNQSLINQYLNARIQLNVKALLSICKIIKVDPKLISPSLAESVPAGIETNIEAGPNIRMEREYPLISWVQAGAWTGLSDNFHPGDAEDWKPCHKNLGANGYILRVKGESMTAPPGERFTFPEGILLYVNPDAEVTPGKFVIVRRNGTQEATFKKLTLVDGEQYLEALNPAWPNRYLKLQADDEFCGVVMHAGFDMP
jgi:SOS-response transcriptional repressor LexA